MPRDLLSRYVWIVDTIRRHGAITRQNLNDLWVRSKFCDDGRPLNRRTFYNYRQAIEELFQLEIRLNPVTYEYSVAPIEGVDESITDWLLNAATTSDTLAGARDLADRIFVEDVPSARTYLSPVIEALRRCHPIRFTYHGYTRALPSPNTVIEPYFLKIFRQRWYVTGRNLRDKRLKTYALDRMSDVNIESRVFEIPSGFDAKAYTAPSFGIIFDEGGGVQTVQLRADLRTAKYLRALPLHPSQEESLHNDYSVFTLRVRLTPDFIQELLSYGPRLTVIAPMELRDRIVASLKATLAEYE